MKKLILLFSMMTFVMSCSDQDKTIQEIHPMTNQYFVENVAITKVNRVSINNNELVYEITFEDFGKKGALLEGLGFDGKTLMDNGKYNDRIAGDGIYTSLETHSIKFAEENPIQFQVLYDESFKFVSKLDLNINNARIFTCRFVPCGCNPADGPTCAACYWFGWECFCLKHCDVSFP